VRGARVEELLRQQAAQPLRRAAHGRRLHRPPSCVGEERGSAGVGDDEGVDEIGDPASCLHDV
jgi:hypothetical protein